MKETYVMEYYLPNQSHLFSAPQRVAIEGYDKLLEKVAIAQKHGYDIIAVYEVYDEGFFTPINAPSLIAAL